MLCYAVPYYDIVLWYDVIFSTIILSCDMLCYAFYRIVLCYAVVCCGMLYYYTALCYAVVYLTIVLSYAMLWYAVVCSTIILSCAVM
jgi:hypothetical protein